MEQRDLAAERPVTLQVLHHLLEERLLSPGVELRGGEADLDPEVESQLRALGYLD